MGTYHRLRCDEQTGEPTNHARNYVRPELAARIDPDDLVRRPMTKVLRDVLGIGISRITDTVEARLADPETARLLEVPLLSPILHYTGITYDTAGGCWTWRSSTTGATASPSRSPWTPPEAVEAA